MSGKRLLTPADVLLLCYIAIVAVLIVLCRTRSPEWTRFMAWQLTCAGVILLIAAWHWTAFASRWSRISAFVHSWYPVILIGVLYAQLRDLIPYVNPHDLDVALATLDHGLFGVHPTVWLERWTQPLVTEMLQIAYALYYLVALVVVVAVWRKEPREHFQFALFAIGLGFTLSYLGYFLVPAIGPRFTPLVLQAQSQSLHGLWLFQRVRDLLDVGEGLTRDCFPSGHTAITLLVMYCAYRFRRRVFWWLLPIGCAIVLSTIYLRYHYVVDVIAGALLAGAVVLVAPRLYRAAGGGAVPDVKPELARFR